MTDSVAPNDSLLNFFLHVSQIFIPMELFHTSGYDRSECRGTSEDHVRDVSFGLMSLD